MNSECGVNPWIYAPCDIAARRNYIAAEGGVASESEPNYIIIDFCVSEANYLCVCA